MIETIRKQILKDTGVLIIPANTTAKKPPLPYGTVNLTSPWIDGKGHPDIFIYQDAFGHHMRRTEDYQMVISFQVYAASDAEAVQHAKVIRNWFSLRGQSLMEDLNVVVVRKGNLENRTTFLVDSYDYKHGFDIQLRATSGEYIANHYQDGTDTDVDYDWIETVELEFKGVE